ncbi:MAG: ribulose-phosphate 3-epimerase [Acidobacteria bacterium]|jgi:ribulose-phosphate 3-epimerase|nr:ribulose-phosphate 3-epimerase [Acidobacteriota bacterium]
MNPVFPSILATNFFNLEDKLRAFAAHGIDFIHLDVMDGHFVDQISFGPSLARAIKEKFPFGLDAHLMVSNPEKAVPHFIRAGADWISFHAEAAAEPAGLLRQIRDAGCRAGLVLNPDTPLERLQPYLGALDYILLMSVFPGYGGQSFIPGTLERVALLKKQLGGMDSACLLQVDGGIQPLIAAQLRAAGADLFVVGTSLFNADDIGDKIHQFSNQLHWSRS